MPTIRDVARAAQVSPSTVSFVLSDRKGVNPETRRKVQSAIRQIGYKPRGVGRPTIDNTARNIAVVCGVKHAHTQYDTSCLNHRWVTGMRDAIIQGGDHFHLFAGVRHIDEDLVLQEAINQEQLDGYILAWEQPTDGYLKRLMQQRTPLVVINRRPGPGQHFSYVEMDNFDAGREVAHFFIERGHRRVAVVQPDMLFNYDNDRAAGFKAGLGDHGFDPVFEAVHGEAWATSELCIRLQESGATAVFFTVSDMAVDCLNAWEQMGVKIPRDLSVVSFDNPDLRTEGGLRPSSVSYDSRRLAEAATHLLVQLIEQRDYSRLSASIRTTLVEHDTTGPPPGK